jgi:hypothetical protein
LSAANERQPENKLDPKDCEGVVDDIRSKKDEYNIPIGLCLVWYHGTCKAKLCGECSRIHLSQICSPRSRLQLFMVARKDLLMPWCVAKSGADNYGLNATTDWIADNLAVPLLASCAKNGDSGTKGDCQNLTGDCQTYRLYLQTI